MEDLEPKKMEDLEPKKMKDTKGKKARQIAQIVHAMSSYCWMLGVLGGFYFFVFTVSNFAPLAQQVMPPLVANPSSQLLINAALTAHPIAGCTPTLAQHIAMVAPGPICALLSTTPAWDCTPELAQYIAMIAPGRVCAMLSTLGIAGPASCASPPTSASHLSKSDKLKAHISGWNRLTVAFLLAAVFFIAMVKPRVDAASKAEDRAATKDDKEYETALDEQRKAHKAASEAQGGVHGAIPRIYPAPALDPHATQALDFRRGAVSASTNADKNVEELRTLVGVARMGVFERRTVRGLFAFSILFSLGAGICSAGAFFRSAQLEMGDSMNLAEVIVIIALAGVPMVLAHMHFLYVAFVEN